MFFKSEGGRMAAEHVTAPQGGVFAALLNIFTQYVSKKSTMLSKLIAAEFVLAVPAALTAAVGRDDISAGLSIPMFIIGIFIVPYAFPIFTAAGALYLVLKRRDAIVMMMLASAAYVTFLFNVDWLADFSGLVYTSICYWAVVIGSLYKGKNNTLRLALLGVLCIAAYGATSLLGGNVGVPQYVRDDPRYSLYGGAVVLSLLLSVWQLNAMEKEEERKRQCDLERQKNELERLKEDGEKEKYEQTKRLYRDWEMDPDPLAYEKRRDDRFTTIVMTFVILFAIAAFVDWKFLT